jgi:hypothetical protein
LVQPTALPTAVLSAYSSICGRWGSKAHALAGLQQLASGDALGLDAVRLQLFLQLVQRGLVSTL